MGHRWRGGVKVKLRHFGGGSKRAREREREGGCLRNVCASMCEEKWGSVVVEGMGYMYAPKVQREPITRTSRGGVMRVNAHSQDHFQ